MLPTTRIRFYAESARLLRLGVPLIIAQLAVIGMAVTDTVMAGQASAIDLAALAVGSGIWITVSVTLLGLCSALAPIVGQLTGAGRRERVGFEVQQGLYLAAVAGALASLALWLAPELLGLFELSPDVRQIAANYLQVLALGALPLAFAAVIRNSIEACGRTRPTMAINLIAFGLNIVLDYALVFGQFGLPKLGAVGCALATALLNWAILLAFVAVTLRRRYRHLQIWQRAAPSWPAIKHQLQVGLPIAVGVAGEVLFFGIQALFLASFGAVVVGAHQIALNFGGLIYMIPLGLAQAICIRVAHAIGENRPLEARFSAASGLALGVFIATISIALTLLLREQIASAYSTDTDVQALAVELLLFCAAYQLLDALQITAWGALRGFKDTRAAMLLQLTAYWLIGFPVGYSLALTDFWGRSYGVQGFWLGIIFGLAAATALLNWRLYKLTR